jgi:glutathione reductase (NADPH)
MDLYELPESIVFIGGGYVSFEFAHMASAAGAKCTIVHRGPAALAGFDADLAAAVVESYRAAGVDIVLDAPVTALRCDGADTIVEAGGRELRCDLAVHGAGRAPDLASLDLAAGNVAAGAHGVEVDDQLRSTSNPHVFACGDAAAKGLPLTPVASRQGKLVARVITGDAAASWGDPVTPTVVFCGPPLASVGLTEKAARDAGLEVDVHFNDTSTWYTSRRVGVKHAAVKTVVEKGTRRILGAHFYSPDAQELVNAVAAAMSAGMTADQLIRLPLTYPTAAMDLEFLF